MSEQKNRREIVCLSGSMRFFQDILDEANKLSLQGKIVLIPFKDPRKKSEIPQEDRQTYIDLHNAQIDMCDRLMVVNPGMYIGKSVEREIEYAMSIGKPVSYLVDPKRYIVTLCGSRRFQEVFDYQFEKLTKEGKIVLTPAIFKMRSPCQMTAAEHAVFDEVHHQKMMLSDEVMIINKAGYIGEDTQKEINWCLAHNLNVTYLEPVEGTK